MAITESDIESLRKRVDRLEELCESLAAELGKQAGYFAFFDTPADALRDKLRATFRASSATMDAIAVLDGEHDDWLTADGAESIGALRDLWRTVAATSNAQKRLAADPKQSAKVEAFAMWRVWQSGKIKHKSGAAFARAVCKAFPIIENPKTVERWVTQWRKVAATKRKELASS